MVSGLKLKYLLYYSAVISKPDKNIIFYYVFLQP